VNRDDNRQLCDWPDLVPQCSLRWESLIAAHHNVLLEGPRHATEKTIGLLQPHLRGPVRRKRHGETLVLDVEPRGTLVMDDVAALNAGEQTRLRRWLDESPRARIVSTASTPLFSQVVRGLFDESLYYRLNVILLRIAAGTDH
jgi:hypothetical protein